MKKSFQTPLSGKMFIFIAGIIFQNFLYAQKPLEIDATYQFTQPASSTERYELSVPAPGEFTIYINDWISTYNWSLDFDRIYIYNDTLGIIDRNSLSSANDPFIFHMFQETGADGLTFRVGQSGTYYIDVHAGQRWEQGNSGATIQNYSMRVTAKYVDDTNEPNDTFESATPMAIGQTLYGYQWRKTKDVVVAGDVDWYVIQIPHPGKLSIELFNWVATYNWYADFDRLYVYNEDGDNIGSESPDPYYSHMMGNVNDTVPKLIEMNLAHSGKYYLKLHSGAGTSTSPYSITSSFIAANDVFEPNDTFADSKLIQNSDVWYDAYAWRSLDKTMNVIGDEDYYHFYAAGAGQYTLSLDGWIGIYNWGRNYDRLYIYDADENSVGASPYRWMMGSAPINFNVPSAGKYYIRLYCGDTYSLDGYRFKLSGLITSLEEIESPLNRFQIYPNPATDIISINSDKYDNEEVTIKFYNALGSLVKTEILTTGQGNFNISDLSNGIYLIAYKSKGYIEKQKLIIQR